MSDKKYFVERQLAPLVKACDLSIVSVEYESVLGEETVIIEYDSTYRLRVNVTADSFAAIVRDVFKEI